MNAKKIIFVLLSLCSIMSIKSQSNEFAYDSLYAGQVNVMGQMMDLPDFSRWHYFAFDENEGVICRGTSEFELEDINAGNVGTEKINIDWKVRTDWDFAFHAYDFRTNSGLAGNGNAGAVFIADSASAFQQGKTLETLYNTLTRAPMTIYHTDTVINGTFFLSLTQGMPPLRASSLSINSATRKGIDNADGASSHFFDFAMQGNPSENPMIIILKTTSEKYVKIYLRSFTNEEGKPGFLRFTYEYIPLETNFISPIPTSSQIVLYPNPVSKNLYINLSESANVSIYNTNGTLIKQYHAQSGCANISVENLAKGVYFIKIQSSKESKTEKIVVL